MKKSFFVLFFLLIASFVFSEDNNVRPPFELKMAVEEEQYFSAQIDQSTYVLPNNWIQLFPGEEVYIEAEVEDNALVNFKRVPEIKNPAKTLVISFEQISEEKLHKYMVLSVKNPFDKELKYSAAICLLKYGKWVETDVLNIGPGIAASELWSDLITSIALYDFMLLTDE